MDLIPDYYVRLALLVGTAFLFGSLPTGFLVGKAFGVDVRLHGSGNTGATNVSRVLGKKLGALVLVVDMMKGFFSVQLAWWYPITYSFEEQEAIASLLGFCALLGHCYSPFLRFRGGKGVATGIGAYLAIAPFQAVMAFSIFWLVLQLSGFVSLGSIIAALAVPTLMLFDPHPFSHWTIACAAATAVVVIVRHSANIRRLLNGTEPPFRKQKSEQNVSG